MKVLLIETITSQHARSCCRVYPMHWKQSCIALMNFSQMPLERLTKLSYPSHSPSPCARCVCGRLEQGCRKELQYPTCSSLVDETLGLAHAASGLLLGTPDSLLYNPYNSSFPSPSADVETLLSQRPGIIFTHQHGFS